MRLVVANGRVVTQDEVSELDVVCDNGRITALTVAGATHSEADEIVDATGLLVLPGFIDPHVHSRDPGLTDKGDFEHATRGALIGGTTTVIEMPNAIPPATTANVLANRRAHHSEHAWTDFALWGLAIGDTNLHSLAPMFREGAAAVKLFWGYATKRDTHQLVYRLDEYPPEQIEMPPDNGSVLRIFEEVGRVNGVLAAHCEDRAILTASEHALGHPVRDYADFLAVRPPVAEATAIAVGVELARASNCRFHVVHLSSAAGVGVVQQAQQRGVPVTAETCPHYLTMSDDDFSRVGPMMKIFPPIRTKTDQAALWRAVNEGVITSFGSDHAPHSVRDKQQDLGSQPAGFGGAQTFGPVMIDALMRGKLTPARFASLMATGSARLYGLYPRKGAIRVGSDADLTIINPTRRHVVHHEELAAVHQLTPWNGVELRGTVQAVVLRGQLAVRDGSVVGPRRGAFVSAGPYANTAEREPAQ